MGATDPKHECPHERLPDLGRRSKLLPAVQHEAQLGGPPRYLYAINYKTRGRQSPCVQMYICAVIGHGYCIAFIAVN